METVRFGIIGLGAQGSNYILNIFDTNKLENATLTAVCDAFVASHDRIKSKVKNLQLEYFVDYKEMLDSGLVDAIIIVVPHFMHDEIACEALKRNINVLCEKPASVYTKQAKAMNEAANASKALYSMMFSQRTMPIYQKAKEFVASGKLGQIQRINWITTCWFRTQFYYNSGAWRATWKGEGGGILLNQAPHQLDLLQWIIGEMPISVRAFASYGKWHDIEVEDEVTAYLEYENGATGVFISSTGENPGCNRFEVVGTKGKFVIDGNTFSTYINEKDTLEFCKTEQTMFGASPYTTNTEVIADIGAQHIGVMQNFANAVLGKEKLLVEGVDGLNSMELINGIALSGFKGGEKVNLPIDDDEYIRYLNEKISSSKKTNN